MRVGIVVASLVATTWPARAFAEPAADPASRAAPYAAPDPARTPLPTPFDRLGPNVADAFTGYNLFYYGGAIAATGVMAWGGADHAIQRGAQYDLRVNAYGDISYYAGYIAPVVVAPGLYLLALALHDRTLAGAGAAATQALAVTVLTTGVLKVATGRVWPTHGGDRNDLGRLDHPEYAREWAPFSFDGRYAWPSGHTSSAISIAAVLSAYYDESIWPRIIGYPIALAIGFGMIDGDHHWASDVVAGGLIGHAIGWSIGRDFRALVREGETASPRWHLRPLAGASYGLAVEGEL